MSQDRQRSPLALNGMAGDYHYQQKPPFSITKPSRSKENEKLITKVKFLLYSRTELSYSGKCHCQWWRHIWIMCLFSYSLFSPLSFRQFSSSLRHLSFLDKLSMKLSLSQTRILQCSSPLIGFSNLRYTGLARLTCVENTQKNYKGNNTKDPLTRKKIERN